MCIRCNKLLEHTDTKRHVICALHMWTNNCFVKDVESHIREQIEIVIIGHISVESAFV